MRIPMPTLLILLLISAAGCADEPPVSARVTQHRWLVTVYYTAVESPHHEAPIMVTGCPARSCEQRADPLGWYPGDFVAAVRSEGAGRITSGPHTGRYLNWAHNVGYWLDDAPRDAHGRALEPFRSAAADGIPDGTRLRIISCGQLDSGDPVPENVCQTFRDADWEIRDQFTPGHGGDHHIDLYIGEESEAGGMSTAELYVTLQNATLDVRA